MPSSTLLYIVLALIAGTLVAVQPGINALLSKHVAHPVQASVISFSAGLLTLLVVCLALGHKLPRPSMLLDAPWWLWIGGGMVGAFFVTTALVVAPKIGAAYWVSLVVAGQVLASLALDHFGVLGFRRQPIDWNALLGAGLVIAGVAVVSARKAG